MDSKEYKELMQAYNNVYEQRIGVPLDKATDDAAARKLQQIVPKGEKVYIPKSGLQKAHYEPEGELVEDLEQRRKQLAQRQREGIQGFKERISARVKANRKRLAKRKEREQIKAEIKREVAKEAVGDPISPNSVFKLSDKDVQKNLQSTMKPAGPPPMKPAAPKAKQQSGADRFVKRIVGSTSLSPL